VILPEKIGTKILSPADLLKRIEFWRTMGDRIVFTNGCFDILHRGHIHLLLSCNTYADRVVVGLNSDSSVKNLKGDGRPINDQHSRATLLAALEFVDAIAIFQERTPENLIHFVRPDVLIKGGDWKKEDIVGSDFVESYGGVVETIPYLTGFSTSQIIARSQK
jgi:D-glycero-beta-D-manno-heptose 1-phosphate adenylyltransferase